MAPIVGCYECSADEEHPLTLVLALLRSLDRTGEEKGAWLQLSPFHLVWSRISNTLKRLGVGIS